MQTDIEFDSHGTTLSGTLYKAEGEEKACILILYGGGNIPHKQSPHYTSIKKTLAENGITSFSFDFRGVGDNGVPLEKTNINTRIEDAKAAFNVLVSNTESKNIYLYGVSMGATVAIEITNQVSTKGIILIVPAAYSLEARGKNFGPDFSEAIRKPESWKDSPDFENLRKYKARVFLLRAGNDQIIPTGVYNTYVDIVQAKGEILTFKDATHRFSSEVDSNGVPFRDILSEHLLSFINS